MRRHDTTPALADPVTGSAERLTRLSVTELTLDEGWVQQLLFENPTILPADEINFDASPLIPVGREIPTGRGYIDCLYVSPTGTLTVVEVKLWKNPEARRAVVAQIIQYADDMSRWSYADLDQRACAHSGKSIWELVRQEAEEQGLGEAEFVDGLARNLERGDFLLLIVGDGIKEDVESMAAFLQRTPQLHFTLALVELRLYQLPGDPRYLAVPSVVARTSEVQRAVVRVTHQGVGTSHVEVHVAEPTTEDTSRVRRKSLDEDEFLEAYRSSPSNDERSIGCLEKLFDLVASERNLAIRFNPGSLAIILRGQNSKSGPASMLTLGTTGIVKFHSVSCHKNLKKRMSEEPAGRIYHAYEQGLVRIFGNGVLHNAMNLGAGPHIRDADGGVDAYLDLLTVTTRDVEREMGMHSELVLE